MIRARLARLVFMAMVATAFLACSASDEPAVPAETPTPGPSERFQTPRTLDSYRFTMSVRADGQILDQSEAPPGLGLTNEPVVIDIEGHWTSPDREYSSVVFSFGMLRSAQEKVRIGERIWTRVEGGAWREQAPLTDPENLIGQEVPLTPDSLFGRDDADILARLTTDLAARPHTLEVVNGRRTKHWSLDEEWFDAYVDQFVEVLAGIPRDQGLLLDIELWSDTETGVGTRLQVVGGFPGQPRILEMDLQMFDINEPGITVDAPIGAITR
ncbi:MAG: hypothetical protein DWG80_02800 [Chloroflexi bacterium]|nr:hypothetical protein [Chloroflexota bacterium]